MPALELGAVSAVLHASRLQKRSIPLYFYGYVLVCRRLSPVVALVALLHSSRISVSVSVFFFFFFFFFFFLIFTFASAAFGCAVKQER